MYREKSTAFAVVVPAPVDCVFGLTRASRAVVSGRDRRELLMRKGVVVVVVVLVFAAGAWSPARAGGTPAQKCAQSKLKATGKKAAAKLKCYKKAVAAGVGIDSECL